MMLQQLQPRQVGIEQVCGHAVPLRHVCQINIEMAHQLFDHGAPQAIFLGHRAHAGDRQVAVMHGLSPGGDRRDVLRIALWQGADRRGAEAEQHFADGRGVTLEIAMQLAVDGMLRQPVVGAGEMIEADPAEAVFHQGLRCRCLLGETRRGIGQGGGIDAGLMRLHPWHMGITEQRDAVGLQCHALLYGADHILHCLTRQAIDQVEIERGDAGLAQGIDGARHQVERLAAIDGGLHAFVQALHAQAGAVDAKRLQAGDQAGVETARIELDGDLGAGLRGEMVIQLFGDALQAVAAQDAGRAATKVQAGQARPRRQVRQGQVDLAQQQLQEALQRLVILHHLRMAAAIPAHLPAEGHMHIEIEGAVIRQLAQPAAPGAVIVHSLEMWRGGVGGIARHRADPGRQSGQGRGGMGSGGVDHGATGACLPRGGFDLAQPGRLHRLNI